MSSGLAQFFDKYHELSAGQQPFVIVTLVHVEGHVPQNVGARAIVGDIGLMWGTVGGGRLEAEAIQRSSVLLADQVPDPVSVRYDLQRDLNMVCGGAATLLYEPVLHQGWNIAVFGAGHVAQATVPILATLPCQIYHIDSRQDWLARIPSKENIRTICTPDLCQWVTQLPKDVDYILMTQGHATDLPIAKAILNRGRPRYLGIIGSSVKARNLKAQLLNEGFNREWVNEIFSPIGLPIGTNQPAEIAISIAAELLQQRQNSNPTLRRGSVE
jgi:xanthine dehydrogenase accessory factor